MYLFFFKFFSPLGCYRVLSRAPSAILLVIYFKYSGVCMSYTVILYTHYQHIKRSKFRIAMAFSLMRNKMKSPFIAFTCYLVFPSSSLGKTFDASEGSVYTGKQYLNELRKLRRRKTQRPVQVPSSPKTEEAADSRMKGKQGAENPCLFTPRLWDSLSCTL